MEVREKFQRELASIKEEIKEIGLMASRAVRRAFEALESENEALAKTVIEDDINIDNYQAKIEDHAASIIAREQPVASDLRELVAAIKIVDNIERIGDHARHLAKALAKIDHKTLEAFLPGLKDSALDALEMLESSLDAYIVVDPVKAKQIAQKDDIIDKRKAELQKYILDAMGNQKVTMEDGMNLLYLNRFMERMGDHVTNICERIYYFGTGEHIELN